MQRFVRFGSAAAKPSGGSTSPLEAHAAWLLELVAKHPDLTLDEIVAAMRREGIAGSRTAVWRFFARHQITVKKKSMRAAEQKRADVARARRRWMLEQGLFDPARLVFVDEAATSTNMARPRGRCARGVRLIGHVPQSHWQTITFVAGLRHDAMVAPMVVEGPITGEMFLAYVEQCLVPTLKHGGIVVMDRLKAHFAAGVREAIEAAGELARFMKGQQHAGASDGVGRAHKDDRDRPRLPLDGSSRRERACQDDVGLKADQLLGEADPVLAAQ
jgi:hypothetical protein